MKEYPKRRNGSEYYPKNCQEFAGRYAKDKDGNDFYPRSINNLFVKNQSGNFIYARDKHGNEFYPIIKNKSVVLLDPSTLDHQIARDANGNELYPKDGYGNEYYLTKNGKPYLLRKADGSTYFAKTYKGSILIPWNHVAIDEKPLLFGKDAAQNLIYMSESDLPKPLKVVIRCLCHIAILCPKECVCKLTSCIT